MNAQPLLLVVPRFRGAQPRLLVICGKYDLLFDPGEPEQYRNDVPIAQVHVLDAGHFALDTKAGEIAAFVREFSKTQGKAITRGAVCWTRSR